MNIHLLRVNSTYSNLEGRINVDSRIYAYIYYYVYEEEKKNRTIDRERLFMRVYVGSKLYENDIDIYNSKMMLCYKKKNKS